MRAVVFSTPTKHHTYFLNRLAAIVDVVGIFYERRHFVPPFPTGPFFEAEQDAFEDRFFDPEYGGTAAELPDSLTRRVVELHSVNQPGAAEHVAALAPDIAISFGTGRLQPHLFDVPPHGTINVHRGLTQYHRGLDSDLWALLDGRLDQVGVTIHKVDAELDTGAVVAQATAPLCADDEIYHLRYKTSVLATDLVIGALKHLEAHGCLPSVPGIVPGPYFSAMPLADKHAAKARFDLEKRR